MNISEALEFSARSPVWQLVHGEVDHHRAGSGPKSIRRLVDFLRDRRLGQHVTAKQHLGIEVGDHRSLRTQRPSVGQHHARRSSGLVETDLFDTLAQNELSPLLVQETRHRANDRICASLANNHAERLICH